MVIEPAHDFRHPVHHVDIGLGVEMAEDFVGVIQHIDVTYLTRGT
jgi:hypothetical protein